MDQTLKEQITRLYHKSRELDVLQEEISKLKEQILPQLKMKGLTKTKFDFDDRYIKFNVRTDVNSITQKSLSTVLKRFPEIDQNDFMSQVLDQRTKKQVECLEIVKSK